MTSSHTTPFAGSWYPGQRAELETLLDELFSTSLSRTGPSLLPRPLAFVVPHAGLVYSGAVAASAYRHIQAAQPKRVFILGFSHRGGPPGVAIPDIESIETPLGEVRVDQAIVRELAAGRELSIVDEIRVCDHSVEIQLPLLQKAAPEAAIVPLYVGTLNAARRAAVARALAAHVQPGDVLVASSDLTHYGRNFGYEPFPADAYVEERLSELDAGAMEAAGSLDPALFLDAMRELDATVCGQAPIALLLETLGLLGGENVFQQTLDYQTSGEITGDFHHSVSYGALGYFPADSFWLDAGAQAALLASARATLHHLCATGERRPVPPDPAVSALARRAGIFVSLHQRGDLFGCVGLRGADQPLAEAAPELTLSAALDDPRFAMRQRIPEGLDLEISVLTPMKRIRSWTSFQVGRDGASLEYEGRTQLLLPQVASHGYSAARFLEALSRKGGLRSNAYRDPQARLSVFRAQVFSASPEHNEAGAGRSAGKSSLH
ncbi:MAG: AmmeMemoRadiSam system protein B [Bryobacteraceae bacterium]|nr:AmmeMemoRadiSam system protein B [Bryobacteraceae bacterium]